MTDIFLKILNMSYSAGWLILAILLLRLVLKKAPKWVNVLLWGIAAVRLLLPFSLESIHSLMPSGELVSPDIMLDPAPTIQSGIPAVNEVINPIIQQTFAPSPGDSMNPLQLWLPLAAGIWVLGILAMLGYTLFSYYRLKKQVSTAVLLRDSIYRSENIPSPFVLGLFRPRIYLPAGISEADMAHVIAHEEAHIHRRDHWWKPLGFLLLSIHWFNPLLWVGYVLLCRDIELACDEKVINELGEDIKADYSQALLNCSVSRKRIAACPLAFGEVGVKQRIKSVLHYKKPAFWILIAAIVVCCVVALCFLTDPVTPKQERVVFLFDDITDGTITVGSQVPGKSSITIQLDRYSAGITHPDGTITTVLSGMPIRNAYFCDLNGDGVAELCAGTSWGFGMLDHRIEVYDFVKQQLYTLQDRGEFNYALSEVSGVLSVTVTNYRTTDIVAKGPLALEKQGIGQWELTFRESVPEEPPATAHNRNDSFGIRKIRLSGKGDPELTLKLDYLMLSGGYSVEMIPFDAPEYTADGTVPYDGALGKYRMMITFGDTNPAASFRDQFSDGRIYEFEDVSEAFGGSLKARIAYPQGHGFVLYIGSDVPFTTETKAETGLDRLFGTLRIKLRRNELLTRVYDLLGDITTAWNDLQATVPGCEAMVYLTPSSIRVKEENAFLSKSVTLLPEGSVFSAYLYDLNGDRVAELCAGVEYFAQNTAISQILVYDFAAQKTYTLQDSSYPFTLHNVNDRLIVIQKEGWRHDAITVAEGTLMLVTDENGLTSLTFG